MNRCIVYFLIISSVNTYGLKVCSIVKSFPHPGQVYMCNQLIGLIDEGHEVTLFSGKQKKDLICTALEPYLDRLQIYYQTLPKEKREYDVILCQQAFVSSLFYELRSQGLTGKAIVFGRGSDISFTLAKNPHEYDHFFEQTDLWLLASDFFKNFMLEMGFNSTKLGVLDTSVDTVNFQPYHTEKKLNKKKIVLMTIGRLVPLKGFEYGIMATALLRHKYPGIRYVIIGDGTLKKKLLRLVKKLRLKKNVFFTGQQNQEQVKNWLSMADVYIQPSVKTIDGIEEGRSTTLKEAMAMEVPVIGTHHAGIPELIQHRASGLLVPERDSFAIKNAVIELIENNSLRKKLAKAGRKNIVEKFDIAVLGHQLHEHLMSLCNS